MWLPANYTSIVARRHAVILIVSLSPASDPSGMVLISLDKFLKRSPRDTTPPIVHLNDLTLRLESIAVPEPTAIAIAIICLVAVSEVRRER